MRSPFSGQGLAIEHDAGLLGVNAPPAQEVQLQVFHLGFKSRFFASLSAPSVVRTVLGVHHRPDGPSAAVVFGAGQSRDAVPAIRHTDHQRLLQVRPVDVNDLVDHFLGEIADKLLILPLVFVNVGQHQDNALSATALLEHLHRNKQET